MATIAVLSDEEEGHLLPSFWLSRRLKDCGSRVCYLAPPNCERLVRGQGFEFISLKSEREAGKIRGGQGYLGPLLCEGMLDGAIVTLQPDVMLILSLYYAAGLAIHYRYKIPVVYFTPILSKYDRVERCGGIVNTLLNTTSGVPELLELLTKARVRFSNLMDIARLALRFPELVLVPEAFDVPDEQGVYHVGAGVDLERTEESFPWDNIDSNSPIIFCALGSQVQLLKEFGRRFFQVIFEVATARPDCQFIISTGGSLDGEHFSSIPTNVIASTWVPQLEVLSRADLMINHGGLNTVKECILMGVPMVVLPLKSLRDHFITAERVVHHGLGVQSDITQISSAELIILIDQVLHDESFKIRVNLMRETFLQQDRFDLALNVLERAISGNSHTSI